MTYYEETTTTYGIRCDECGRELTLPAAGGTDRAYAEAFVNGWVRSLATGQHYCSFCAREALLALAREREDQ